MLLLPPSVLACLQRKTSLFTLLLRSISTPCILRLLAAQDTDSANGYQDPQGCRDLHMVSHWCFTPAMALAGYSKYATAVARSLNMG